MHSKVLQPVSDFGHAAPIERLLTSCTDANRSICGDNLEDNVEGREDNRISLELASLNNGDQKDSKRDPPQVMAKLRSQLLSNEVCPVPACHLAGTSCELPF